MYPAKDIVVPSVPEGYYETIPAPARKSIGRHKDRRDLKPESAREVIRAYYASITFADAQLGRVLDLLEANGLTDKTIVLFTSDHGYHMGEHGHYKKTTLFENAARVSLVIAGPGVTAPGQATDALAEMVDFYPTLAELAGLKAPEYVIPSSSSRLASRDPASAAGNRPEPSTSFRRSTNCAICLRSPVSTAQASPRCCATPRSIGSVRPSPLTAGATMPSAPSAGVTSATPTAKRSFTITPTIRTNGRTSLQRRGSPR